MFNKDALVSLEQSCKILKSCLYRPLSFSSLKSLKNSSFTPLISLSLALSIIFSPCISFAKTLDKLGDYSNYSDADNDGYGGAYAQDGYLDTINGNYFKNSATLHGGAIYNTANGWVNAIYGSFYANTLDTSDADAGGAALYNAGYIGNIYSNFTDNIISYHYAVGGGAIYNAGYIAGIYSNFSGNKAGTDTELRTYTETSSGGAIYNISVNPSTGYIGTISGNFYQNIAASSVEYSGGGAIYNNKGIINNILGSFEDNTAGTTAGTAMLALYTGGGAIYNYAGTIYNLDADFINNHANNSNSRGGAILNYGLDSNNISYIGAISGSFTYNEATNYGGAIYNSEYAVISSINGIFSNNYLSGSGQSQFGAAIANDGEIGTILGSFIGNYLNNVNTSSNHEFGGAIYNNGTIDSIIANFTGNYLTPRSSSSSAHNLFGGAIYNSGYISSIYGFFDSNFVTGNGYITSAGFPSYAGGAIYNSATIGSIGGNFNNNKISTPTNTNSLTISLAGGAIYNGGSSANIGAIIADFTENTISITGSYSKTVYGGALYNGISAKIASISGDFTNNGITTDNTSYGYTNNLAGGAIYNAANINGNIEGDFSGNYAIGGTYANAYGGAIANTSTITGSILGDFSNNYITIGTSYTSSSYYSSRYAYGGAIYNTDSITGSIIGDFTNNSVTSVDNSSYNNNNSSGGGAIYNSGIISGIISGDFTGNEATVGSSSTSYGYFSGGGAIYNTDTTGAIIANFENNSTNQLGGAILNTSASDLGTISGNFIGNKSNITNGGGAIYSTGNLKFLANNATYQFTDNLAGSDYNAIYIGTDTLRTLAFNMTGTGGFVMNDSISAGQLTSSLTSGYYNLTMTGQNLANNTFALNASITGLNTLDVSNATLSLGSYLHENGSITQGSIEGNLLKFTNSNVAIDVSAVDTTSAAIQASSSTVNSLDYGRVNVSDSTLTLNRASAGESYLLATSTSDIASTWWEEDDIKTTSLLTTSIADYASLDPLDPNYDSLYNKNTTFTVITTLNTDNEILNSDFASLALASVDGTITNGATLDYIQKLTHEDISANDQSRLLEGGARISSASGASTNVKTAMVTSKNLLSARFDLVDSYALNGKITQLASNGLVMQETSSNISAWVMPMYAHESVDGMEAGSFTTAYKTDLYGVLAGMDTSFDMPFVDLARLGFSMNFGLGNSASSGDFENIDNDFKYYGAAFYASTQKGDNLAIHADLGYTATNSKVAYGLNGYSTDTKAQIDSSAMHLGALAEYSVYKENNVNLAPYVGVELLSIKTKDYDLEEDNASADTIFNMETDRQNLILIPVGAKVSKTHQARSNWLWLTQAKIGGQLALGNTHETVTVKAPNTSVYDTFTTQSYDMLSADAGFAIKAQNDSWQLGIDMNTQLSKNRLGLSLAGEIEYAF